ncbi:protein FAM186A [Sorex araneus]|uniref:protein FAM186A n=1 Tax=Sorex araneus TaxID=42254 RepID=UPI00243350B5|nr:protein FAM186A [Sorex araneus]
MDCNTEANLADYQKRQHRKLLEVMMQLNCITENVQRIINRYNYEDPTYSGKKISITEHKKRRNLFLEKINSHAKSVENSEKTLAYILAWLEEWSGFLPDMTEADINEYYHCIAKLQILPTTLKSIENNVDTLSRICTYLIDERRKQKRKTVFRGTLWKSWKERATKRPATAHALKPEQILSDDFATKTKISEIQDMLQELAGTSMFTKLESNAIKYISATISSLSKALTTLNDEVKVLTVQSDTGQTDEEDENKKNLVNKQIISYICEKNEMLQQSLQIAEEKYERLCQQVMSATFIKPPPELPPQSSLASTTGSTADKETESIVDAGLQKEAGTLGMKWDSTVPHIYEDEQISPDKEISQGQLSQKRSSYGIDQPQKKRHVRSLSAPKISGSKHRIDKDEEEIEVTKTDIQVELPPLEEMKEETGSDSTLVSKSPDVSYDASSIGHKRSTTDRFRKIKSAFLFDKKDTKDTRSDYLFDKKDTKDTRSDYLFDKKDTKDTRSDYLFDKKDTKDTRSESTEEETPEPKYKDTRQIGEGQSKTGQIKIPTEKVKRKKGTHSEATKEETPESIHKDSRQIGEVQSKTSRLKVPIEKVKPKRQKRILKLAASEEGEIDKNVPASTKSYKLESASKITRETSEFTRDLESQQDEHEQRNIEDFQKSVVDYLKDRIKEAEKLWDKKTWHKELVDKKEDEDLGVIKEQIEEYFEKVADTVTAVVKKYKDIKKKKKRVDKQKEEDSIIPELNVQMPSTATSAISTSVSYRSTDPKTDHLMQRMVTEIVSEGDISGVSVEDKDQEEQNKNQEDYLQKSKEKDIDMSLKSQSQKERDEMTDQNLEKGEADFHMEEEEQTEGQEKEVREKQPKQRMQVQIEQGKGHEEREAQLGRSKQQQLEEEKYKMTLKEFQMTKSEEEQGEMEFSKTDISREKEVLMKTGKKKTEDYERIIPVSEEEDPQKHIIATTKQEQELGTTLLPAQAEPSEESLTLEYTKMQVLGVTQRPEQAIVPGITVAPEQAKVPGVTLTPEQAQALGVTLTPEQVQAGGVTLTLQQAKALGLPLTPDQMQVPGVTLTPEQAQALGVTLTPEQSPVPGITLAPEQAQVPGVTLTPEQAQALGITLTPEQAQVPGVTLTPEQAQALGITLTPEQAQVPGVTLTPEQAQALGVTLTPEQVQAGGVTLTLQQAKALGLPLTPDQMQALGITLTPEQAQVPGVTLTPEQAQALGVTLTPEQVQAGGVTLTLQQAKALGLPLTPDQMQVLGVPGVTLTPEQAQALGITLTPEQVQAGGVTLTLQQAKALGLPLTPDQMQELGLTLTPQQEQMLGITPTPQRAQELGVTLTPQQEQILGITPTPQMAQELGITPTPQRAQELEITPTPQRAQQLGVTLTPQQEQILGITSTPQREKELGVTPIPQRAQELGVTLTPQRAQELGVTLTPQRAQEQGITLTPQQEQILGIAPTPQRAQELGIMLTPQQEQMLGITPTPQRAQELGIMLTPQQEQMLGITPTPQRAQELGVTPTPQIAQELGITPTPQRAQELGITLTPQQEQMLGITPTPQRAQELGITPTPQRAQELGITLTPQIARELGITPTPQRAQELGVTLTPQQEQMLGITPAPQRAQELGVTLTPQQEQMLGITPAPQRAQELGITPTPQRAQEMEVTLTPQQEQMLGITPSSQRTQQLGVTLTPQQEQMLGIPPTPQRAQELGVTLTPQQEQILGITPTPQMAQELEITPTSQRAQELGVTLTPQQEHILGITPSPQRAQELGVTLTPSQAMGITPIPHQVKEAGVTPTLEQAQGITLTPQQSLRVIPTPQQALSLAITHPTQQAETLGITSMSQAMGVTLTQQQKQALGLPLASEQAEQGQAMGISLPPEQAQVLGVHPTLDHSPALKAPLTMDQARKLAVPLPPGMVQEVSKTVTLQQTQALGDTPSQEQKQTVGTPALDQAQVSGLPIILESADELIIPPSSEQTQALGLPLTSDKAQDLESSLISKPIPSVKVPFTSDKASPRGRGRTVMFEQDLNLKASLLREQSSPVQAPSTLKPFPKSKITHPFGKSMTPSQAQESSAPIAEKSSKTESSIAPKPSFGALKFPQGTRIPPSLISKGSSLQVPATRKQGVSVVPHPPDQPLAPGRESHSFRQFLTPKDVPTTRPPLKAKRSPDFSQPLIPEVPLTSRQIPTPSSFPGKRLEFGPLTSFKEEKPQSFSAVPKQSPQYQAPSPLGQYWAPRPLSGKTFPQWIPPIPGHPPTPQSPSPSQEFQRDFPSSVSMKRKGLPTISSPKAKSTLAYPGAPQFKAPRTTIERFPVSKSSDTAEEIQRLRDPLAMEPLRILQSYETDVSRAVSHKPFTDGAALPTLVKSVTPHKHLKTPHISPSELDKKSQLSLLNKPLSVMSVSSIKKPKMTVPSPQELEGQKFFIDVEAQKKNLILLNQASKAAGLPSQLHTTARNLIVETLHTDSAQMGYLFRKYIAYRLIQQARNNIIKRMKAIQNTGKGYEFQNLSIMLSRLDDYQKKVMQIWMKKQKSIEEKRDLCLREMITTFSQLQEMYGLNLSLPIPIIKEQTPVTKAPSKPVQQPFPEELMEEDRKYHTFKEFRQQGDQMEAIWNTDLSTSSYPITEKKSLNLLWDELGGYPDIPLLLQLDIQSILRKSLSSIQSRIRKLPKVNA